MDYEPDEIEAEEEAELDAELYEDDEDIDDADDHRFGRISHSPLLLQLAHWLACVGFTSFFTGVFILRTYTFLQDPELHLGNIHIEFAMDESDHEQQGEERHEGRHNRGSVPAFFLLLTAAVAVA